jgi:L-iditol 2-dehydrogenase
MKALVLENVRDLQLKDVLEPELARNDVLIQVKACGICGSDVHGYDGSTGRRIPPIIMGHEAAGVVIKVGPEVRTVAVGDRVTFDSTVSCGTCSFCRTGDVNLCNRRQVLGVSCGDYRRNGAFAEYVAVPAHIVYALPLAFPFEKAALIEAVSIAVHAAKITEIKLADPELMHKLNRSAGGQGIDIVVEVVGTQSSITTAIKVVRRGGTVTLIGNVAPTVEIPLQSVVTRQLSPARFLCVCGRIS